ncbi:MAG: Hpt domain-containing protein, partial [Nitrospirae bacterium]|nr:Hpt domain-containing protein [Nitrospirota bacterium]
MNIEKYHKIFFDETSEELNSLENLLLDIDRVSSDIESINSIFRLFHRLKSSSAMMGLNNFSDLSHHAEDLLSGVKEGRIDIGESVTGALLSVVDTMRRLIKEAESGNITGYRSDDLLIRLKEICGETKGHENNPPLPPLEK